MVRSCVLVGLGQIGMDYDFDLASDSSIYSHARAITMHPEFRLIGAVDVSSKQRSRFEQRYDLPAFDQLEVALDIFQPDIVVIATPSQSHAKILAKVIDLCRPQLVLCEKPLACDLNEARAMVASCKLNGISLMVNYIRRSDPGVNEVKRRIDTAEISPLLKVNAWYSKGIWNNGSHCLNLLEFWLGDITAVTVIDSGRLWNNHDPEPDVAIHFDRGRVICRAAWEEAYSYFCVEVLSHSGRLRYDDGGECIEWQGLRKDPNFPGYSVLSTQKETILTGMNIYQWHVYDQICRYLNGAAANLCTGTQALRTIEAIDLINRQR